MRLAYGPCGGWYVDARGGRHGDWPSSGGDEAGADFISFDAFRIDCAARRLIRDGSRIRIQQKPLDVLVYLARNHSRVVPRDELLEQFWPRTVNDESLTRCISAIRRLLGDAREPPRFIETLWGQGYRFLAPVEVWAAAHRPAEEFSVHSLKSPPADGTADPDSRQSPVLTANRCVSVAAARQEGAGKTGWWSPRWLGVAAAALLLIAGLAVVSVPTDPPRAIAVQGLAVLPMASDPGTEDWLAAALTDHLVETVSRIEGIRVVARGSTAPFSRRSDPREIGKQLGVDSALITHLERAGNLTSLHAQLVSTRDGSVLWSFRAAPTEEGVADEQVRQLAQSVARRLWANLQLREAGRPVDRRAYLHYLRGRYYWSQRSSIALAAAIRNFDAALALEPDYVEALLGLADCWLVMSHYSGVSPSEAFPKARAAAERALALDRGAAHAHAVLGVIAMQYDWDWTEAEAQLRRALTLNPNDASAEQWLGELYCYRLRQAECRKHLLAASGLDPLSPVLRMMRGSPALFSGDFGAAVATYSQALREVPEFPFAHYVLGLSYAGAGDWDRAISSYEASLPDLGLAVVGGPLVYALARKGATAKANGLLEELETLADSEYVPPTKIATAWVGLGQNDRALEWLERALDVRDDRLVYLAVDAHFLELHDDADFRAYVERVGLLDVLHTREYLAQRMSAPQASRAGDDSNDGGTSRAD